MAIHVQSCCGHTCTVLLWPYMYSPVYVHRDGVSAHKMGDHTKIDHSTTSWFTRLILPYNPDWMRQPSSLSNRAVNHMLLHCVGDFLHCLYKTTMDCDVWWHLNTHSSCKWGWVCTVSEWVICTCLLSRNSYSDTVQSHPICTTWCVVYAKILQLWNENGLWPC